MIGNLSGRVKTWLTAGAGTVVAVSIAGLLGAFGALPKPAAPEFPADRSIEVGQWLIQPVRAYASEGRPYGMPLKKDQKALVLEVDMTNRTAESTMAYFSVFELTGPLPDGADKPFIALARDSTMSPELHPGLTERMAYVWPISRNADFPERLSLTIIAQTFKPRDNLYGLPGWFNPHEVGRIVLPIEAAEASPETPQ
jgi:hypothetical protein